MLQWEGGFREPGIVRYPPLATPGQRLTQLASTMDIFVTALELAGVDPPPGRPLDGKSLLPILSDGKYALRRLNQIIRKEGRKRKTYPKWHKQIAKWKKEYPLHWNPVEGFIMPQAVIHELYELTKGEAILTTGVGQHQMWAGQFYDFAHTGQVSELAAEMKSYAKSLPGSKYVVDRRQPPPGVEAVEGASDPLKH